MSHIDLKSLRIYTVSRLKILILYYDSETERDVHATEIYVKRLRKNFFPLNTTIRKFPVFFFSGV